MWYRRDERQYRISLFFSFASLAGAFGGILAYGIAHMRDVGGYAGWRWIFILVGPLSYGCSLHTYTLIGRPSDDCDRFWGVLVYFQLPRKCWLAIER